MFGFKKRQIQKKLLPAAWKNEHTLGCALLDAFTTMTASQQVCLHCGSRGGFEMKHHQDCVVGAAAYRLFSLAKYDVDKGRYLTFEESK